MPRAANGTYSLPALNPVVTGTSISSTWANNTMDDIATALTGSLSRAGQGPMLAALELVDGSSGTPGLSFDSEPTTGWYRAGAGDVRCMVGGVEITKATANSFRVQGTAPALELFENDAAANNGRWDLAASGEALLLRTLTDAGVAVNAMAIQRTAGVVDSITFAATTFAVTGNQTVSGSLTVAGTSVNAAGILTSGTLADARVAQSNVTQHQAALGTTASTVSTIARRDGSGDIAARLFRSEYAADDASSVAEVTYRVNNSSDNYLRSCSLTRFKRQVVLNCTIQSDPGGTPSGSPGDVFFYY